MPKKLKKQKLSLKSVWLISCILILNGCARVQIKDAEYCGDMGELGATCFHTLTNEARDMDKAQWDTERFGMICTKASSYADLKAALLKLCHYSKICTYEDKQAIAQFWANLDAMSERFKQIK